MPGRVYLAVPRYLLLFFVLFLGIDIAAQVRDTSFTEEKTDTLSKEYQKELKRTELRESGSRVLISGSSVFARLRTSVSFEVLDGLLTAHVSLEDHLGLPGTETFFTGEFLYRITPASGIYARYYGINRKKHWELNDEIVFLEDTLDIGLRLDAYFNTQVVTAGYLLSVLQDPESFLGFYFNVYVMDIGTGVQSGSKAIDSKVNLAAPLPNFGVVAQFRIKKWLHFTGNIGFFSLYTKEFGGTIYDLNAALLFKPAKWIGFTVSYQEFDINVFFKEKHVNTTVDYNFRGPAVGLNLNF